MAKDTFLQGAGSPQTSVESSAGAKPDSRLAPEIQLELERLRAERDAMAAELQEERAERLRAEERLRMFEREKLGQMRQGAAAREKLASELEEARLRAMRAEARQAALEADTRLAEIETRRRGPWEPPQSEGGPAADEVAEATEGESDGIEDSVREEARETSRPRERAGDASGAGSARPFGGAGAARGGHPSGRPERSGSTPTRTDQASTSKPTSTRTGPGSRAGAKPSGDAGAKPSAGAGAKPSSDTGAKSSGGAGSAKKSAAGRGGSAARPDRPLIDRAQLETRLQAGAVIRTTERFRQFQPVSHTHIKVCDWLSQSSTYAELAEMAEGQLPDGALLDTLALFLERSFILLEQR